MEAELEGRSKAVGKDEVGKENPHHSKTGDCKLLDCRGEIFLKEQEISIAMLLKGRRQRG